MRKEESDDNYLLLIMTVCASVVIVIISVVIIVYCYKIKFNSIKSSSHSNSFTILEYDKKSSKELEKPLKEPQSIHLPGSEAGAFYRSLQLPGTLSRCSTLRTYLPDDSHLSEDNYDTVTLPRTDSLILSRSESIPKTSRDFDAMRTKTQSLSSMFTVLTNQPYSRECISTISSVPDPLYGCIRRTVTIPPHYQSYIHTTPTPTLWHHRPGYVTLPRRPKSNQNLPPDSHGPKPSNDCGHSYTSTLLLNKTKSYPYQRKSPILPPFSPASSPLNTVGIPVVDAPVAIAEADIQERSPSPQSNSSRVCLDTIVEQE